MDFDGDGQRDMLSGSGPGEIYLFRGGPGMTFESGRPLTGRDGEELSVGSESALEVIDWDRDGDLDLLVGLRSGEVYFIPGEKNEADFQAGDFAQLMVRDRPLDMKGGYAGPCVVDWDGDGKHDLLVGDGDGSVFFFRNLTDTGMPELKRSVRLVRGIGEGRAWVNGESGMNKGPGERSKLCVADYNGDGRDDLILGDLYNYLERKPELPDEEKEEVERARAERARLSRSRTRILLATRRLIRDEMGISQEGSIPNRFTDEYLRRLQKRIGENQEYTALNDSLEILRLIVDKATGYRASNHGRVWVFERR